jgi:hypothetical protein
VRIGRHRPIKQPSSIEEASVRPNGFAVRSGRVEERMRKSRDPESDQQRDERLKRKAQTRIEEAGAEETALDAAVRQSMRLYGP